VENLKSKAMPLEMAEIGYRHRSPCASCVFLYCNKFDVQRCSECDLRRQYWTLRHDSTWRCYSDYLIDEPLTIYREDDMAEVDKSAGFFPRFITAGDPLSQTAENFETGKAPIDGHLVEAACELARLLGEFVGSKDKEQIVWAFNAMDHLKREVETYYQEIHGEALSDE
jgi:hypothetical protein